MNRRRTGQIVAALVAVASFAWAAWAAHTSAIPELQVYDGYWMILGASLANLAVTPLVWRWPRELSLVGITVVTVLGSVAPLVISALRHGMPLGARLRGSWVLGGADLVGPALVIGFVCLWFAIREYESPDARAKRE
jgi:hypothetical protein